MKNLTEKAHAVIDKSLKEKLVARAEQDQRSEGAVIRMALREYLKGEAA